MKRTKEKSLKHEQSSSSIANFSHGEISESHGKKRKNQGELVIEIPERVFNTEDSKLKALYDECDAIFQACHLDILSILGIDKEMSKIEPHWLEKAATDAGYNGLSFAVGIFSSKKKTCKFGRVAIYTDIDAINIFSILKLKLFYMMTEEKTDQQTEVNFLDTEIKTRHAFLLEVLIRLFAHALGGQLKDLELSAEYTTAINQFLQLGEKHVAGGMFSSKRSEFVRLVQRYLSSWRNILVERAEYLLRVRGKEHAVTMGIYGLKKLMTRIRTMLVVLLNEECTRKKVSFYTSATLAEINLYKLERMQLEGQKSKKKTKEWYQTLDTDELITSSKEFFKSYISSKKLFDDGGVSDFSEKDEFLISYFGQGLEDTNKIAALYLMLFSLDERVKNLQATASIIDAFGWVAVLSGLVDGDVLANQIKALQESLNHEVVRNIVEYVQFDKTEIQKIGGIIVGTEGVAVFDWNDDVRYLKKVSEKLKELQKSSAYEVLYDIFVKNMHSFNSRFVSITKMLDKAANAAQFLSLSSQESFQYCEATERSQRRVLTLEEEKEEEDDDDDDSEIKAGFQGKDGAQQQEFQISNASSFSFNDKKRSKGNASSLAANMEFKQKAKSKDSKVRDDKSSRTKQFEEKQGSDKGSISKFSGLKNSSLNERKKVKGQQTQKNDFEALSSSSLLPPSPSSSPPSSSSSSSSSSLPSPSSRASLSPSAEDVKKACDKFGKAICLRDSTLPSSLSDASSKANAALVGKSQFFNDFKRTVSDLDKLKLIKSWKAKKYIQPTPDSEGGIFSAGKKELCRIVEWEIISIYLTFNNILSSVELCTLNDDQILGQLKKNLEKHRARESEIRREFPVASRRSGPGREHLLDYSEIIKKIENLYERYLEPQDGYANTDFFNFFEQCHFQKTQNKKEVALTLQHGVDFYFSAMVLDKLVPTVTSDERVLELASHVQEGKDLLEKLLNENSKTEEERDKVKAEFVDEKAKKDEALKVAQSKDSIIETQKKTIDDQEKTIDDQGKTIDDQGKTIEKQNTEKENLTNEKANLVAEHKKKLKEETDKLKDKHEQEKLTLENEKQEAIAEKEKEINVLERDLDEETDQLAEARIQLNSTRENVEKLTVSNAGFQQEVAKLNGLLTASTKEIKEKTRVIKQQKLILEKEKREAIAKKEEEINDLDSKLTEEMSNLSRTKIELHTANENINKLSMENKKKTSVIEQQQKKIALLEAQLNRKAEKKQKDKKMKKEKPPKTVEDQQEYAEKFPKEKNGSKEKSGMVHSILRPIGKRFKKDSTKEQPNFPSPLALPTRQLASSSTATSSQLESIRSRRASQSIREARHSKTLPHSISASHLESPCTRRKLVHTSMPSSEEDSSPRYLAKTCDDFAHSSPLSDRSSLEQMSTESSIGGDSPSGREVIHDAIPNAGFEVVTSRKESVDVSQTHSNPIISTDDIAVPTAEMKNF